MPDQLEADYNTLSREDLVKVATDLRAERDQFRDQLDMLRRGVRTDMRRFCEDVVPDFTPLGGNRPDCAVASGVAVSLSEAASNSVAIGTLVKNPLPLDVFACAAGILCAPVIIDGGLWIEAARQLCERRGPARILSFRLRFNSEEAGSPCGYFPWITNSLDYDSNDYIEDTNDYQSVFVTVELPPELVALPHQFLRDAPMVRSIDLRSTRLATLRNHCIGGSRRLSQVHLPSTVTSIGNGFLMHASDDLTSIDLRHLTELTFLGDGFMEGCDSLTEVHLPPSVTQISYGFLQQCRSIVSIDLRHLTGLTSIGGEFMSNCDSLMEVHLPPSVTQISAYFLCCCPSIVSLDLRHLTGLASLGAHFMAFCSSLTEVHLPPSITEISTAFLSRCTSIVSIDLRHLRGLASLGKEFLTCCTSSTEVHLPDSVRQLPLDFLARRELDRPVCFWAGSGTAPAGTFKKADGKYGLVELEDDDDGGDSSAPLGKLSRGQIEKGQSVLEKLEGAIEGGRKNELNSLSSQFFTLIPTDTSRNQTTAITTIEKVKQLEELLKFYLRMGFDEGEPVDKYLGPISGIAHEDLPKTLNEAARLLCVVLEIEKCVKTGNKLSFLKKGDPTRSMTEDEYASILLYTSNAIYADLNRALRSESRSAVKKYFKYLGLLFHASDALPEKNMTLWRGISTDLSSQYKKGSDITWWGVSSCTADKKVAENFISSCGGDVSFLTIDCQNSVPISDITFYSNEKESLLLPGTKLHVVDCKKTGKVAHIHLREVGRRVVQ